MNKKEKTERFTEYYRDRLSQLKQEKPREFMWEMGELDNVISKMVDAFIRGSAHIGPASKYAAVMCGIKPTTRSIKEYLNADD
jgi:hypothetical protein